MKKLNFIYRVRYSFSVPVTDHCYALRILPETNEEQGIYASEYQISGGNSYAAAPQNSTDSSRDAISQPDKEPEILWNTAAHGHIVPGHDGFGNALITGTLAVPHDRFSLCVTGTAYTRRERMRKFTKKCEPMYRYPTDLTKPGDQIRAFWYASREAVRERGKSGKGYVGGETFGRALAWMDLLSREFAYRSGVTGIRTTAEDAFAGKSGVCQDYAHILITLLRLDGIPARYVAGMLIGEGATHAWCEAWCEGVWAELDPTHNCMLTDDYIEVAHGRDYRDCIMDRGIFRGFALQEQEVYVKVSESEKTSVGRLGIL